MTALYTPYSKKPQLTFPSPIPTQPIAQTQLFFNDVSVSSLPSSKTTYSLPITISTGTNKVTAVQLELQYDPKVLTQVSVVPGVFFTNPATFLNRIDTATGRISYAFGVNPTEQGKMGNSIVAILTFQTNSLQPVQTGITFLPKTLVTAEGVSQSVLKDTREIQFMVGPTPTTSSTIPNSNNVSQ